jgi:hypothetical protein
LDPDLVHWYHLPHGSRDSVAWVAGVFGKKCGPTFDTAWYRGPG